MGKPGRNDSNVPLTAADRSGNPCLSPSAGMQWALAVYIMADSEVQARGQLQWDLNTKKAWCCLR